MVKSTMDISHNFVAFSEYMNFTFNAVVVTLAWFPYFYSDCPWPSHDCDTVCSETFVMINYLLRIAFDEKLECYH
jgi:hypothetical protein